MPPPSNELPLKKRGGGLVSSSVFKKISLRTMISILLIARILYQIYSQISEQQQEK